VDGVYCICTVLQQTLGGVAMYHSWIPVTSGVLCDVHDMLWHTCLTNAQSLACMPNHTLHAAAVHRLPLLAFFSFGAHVMTHHTAPPAWGQLGLDAVEYGAAPVVAYWGVTWTLRGLETAESYMVRASRRTNGQGSAASHPAGAIRAIMHIGLCIVQLWVAAAGPLPLPSEWSSSYISAPVKAGLLAASHHLAYGSSRYMVSRGRALMIHRMPAAMWVADEPLPGLLAQQCTTVLDSTKMMQGDQLCDQSPTAA
jgi:hypothetical protein